MKFKIWRRSASAVLLSLLAASCGGSGGGAAGPAGAVAAITVAPAGASVNTGQTVTFSAVATDAAGAALIGTALAWQSSNTTVATVADGVATGVAPGSAGITASAGGVTSGAAALSVTAAGSGPGPGGSNPTLGGHGLAFHRINGSVGARLSTPAMTTQSGSTMLVFLAKSTVSNLTAPADNKGNAPYAKLGTNHEYTLYRGQGTALFAFNGIVGGANHVVSVDDSNLFDEVTFTAVEVRNGGVVQAHTWSEVLNAVSHTSQSVTTTGPATLVAVWYGDDSSSTLSNPVPNNGFTVIERQGISTETVATFVATKDVAAAGTYNVTWATTPRQGAQLYLVAVQKR